MFYCSLLFKKDGNLLPHKRIKTAPHPSKQTVYYVKWRESPLEESTWEPLSNLNNAQEAIQLYLNKNNWEGGSSGEEGDDDRIDNSPPLEPQAQERELNPEPGSPGPMDHRTARPHFSGIEPCKLKPKMMAHAVKQTKPRKLLHQVECQSQHLMELPKQ
ncbi:M-phase phosphoprotein 8 [Entomophthora muscae]|uniref:M-phase phosphoprotein 8 n=1 Tax=Entomophthora muscae TaxID=34485 RepID=A0ACC2SKC3_9FUNG|nr:M-phase phosphoprotein 8 [Entomophthora muscae]